MADQEVGTHVVEKMAKSQNQEDVEDDKTSVQGESLLLPLLQELLDKRQSGLPLNRSGSNHSSEGSTTAAGDSGTESGEDLRLIAAGICEDQKRQNNAEPLGPELLTEVQSALSRLAVSLQATTEGEMEHTRRKSMLELIDKLQTSLIVPVRPPTDPKNNPHRRFTKTRSRQHRHTVGVSSEELAAARKLMEEVVLKDNIQQKGTTIPSYDMQKQNSDGNFSDCTSSQNIHVQNTTPKPFIAINKPQMDIQSYKIIKNLHETQQKERSKDYRKSISLDSEIQSKEKARKVLTTYISLDSIHQNDELISLENRTPTPKSEHSENEEESTLKLEQNAPKPLSYKFPQVNFEEKMIKPDSVDQVELQNKINLSKNEPTEPKNRYSSKKLKMKRANTIDIPKPPHILVHEQQENENFVLDPEQQLRRNYLALRGPIRVGNTPKTIVPSFEPKTENDKKFMAFIQKHNNNSSISSIWSKPPENKVVSSQGIPEHNWNRKFGNIKTIFEAENKRASSPAISSAKKFWQQAEVGKKTVTPTVIEKAGRKPGKIFQSIDNNKETPPKLLPWTDNNKVVTGSLRVENAPQANVQNNLIQGKHYKFIPQPLPVNKFSHAPMSAFKPPKKLGQLPKQETLDEPQTPLYLYSPKHLSFEENSELPKVGAPWLNDKENSEHRVLNIAASKFENKESKTVEPYRVVEQRGPTNHGRVRRMSGDYDSKTFKQKYEDQYNPKEVRYQKYEESIPSRFKKENDYAQTIYKAYEPQNQVTYPENYYPEPKTYYENSNQYVPESYKPYQEHRKASEENVLAPLTIYNNTTVDQKPKEHIPEFYNGYQTQSYTPESDSEVRNYTIPNDRFTPEYGLNENINSYQKYDDSQFVVNQLYQKPEEPKSIPYYENVAYAPKHENVIPPPFYETRTYVAKEPETPDCDTFQAPKRLQFYNEPDKIHQEIPKKVERRTSVEYMEKKPLKIFDFSSPEQSPDKLEEVPKPLPEKPYVPEVIPQVVLPEVEKASPKKPVSLKIFAFSSPEQSPVSSVNEPGTPLTEYKAVSKVMEGPKSQQAVTVSQNTPKRREEHDIASRNLQAILEKRSASTSPHPLAKELKRPKSVSPRLEIQKKPKQIPERVQYQISDPPKSQKEQSRIEFQKQLQELNASHVPQIQFRPEASSERSQPFLSNDRPAQTSSEGVLQKVTQSPQIQFRPEKSERQSESRKSQLIENSSKSGGHFEETVEYQRIPQVPQTQFKPTELQTNQSLDSRRPDQIKPIMRLERSADVIAQKIPQSPQVQFKPPEIHINNKTIISESYECENNGETVLSSKLQIPVNKGVSFGRKEMGRVEEERHRVSPGLRRDDSWQIRPDLVAKPSPVASPRASPRHNALQKAKSSHSLAVPKQFEAGLNRDEVEQKKKNVMAYFGPSQETSHKEEKGSSNSHKRFQKMKSHGLSRSQTMPHVSYSDLLEEVVDVDAEFENIFKASVCK